MPGSGVYQHLDEGLQPTIRDLAELMITVSDNWATDIIYRRLGEERIAAMLQDLELNDTSLPLTIRELFCTLAELDPDDPKVTWDYLREYLKTYDPKPDNIGMLPDPRNDVSSPADMVRLMGIIHRGEGLTSGEPRRDDRHPEAPELQRDHPVPPPNRREDRNRPQDRQPARGQERRAASFTRRTSRTRSPS